MFFLLGLFTKFLPNLVLQYMRGQNDKLKIVVDAETDRRKISMEAAAKEQDTWMGRLPIFLIGVSVAAYISQVIWSSMLQHPEWGPLKMPQDFRDIMFVVVIAYFGYRVSEKIIDKVTARWFK